ncbi:hypothetical protein MNBD_NITROSPIRAE03-489 [hydrothermal vent metagenome]|uniref:PPC domain-containing protein n=1 Tax=hydrothermal vent metagenome TaxID=652676 RepID=A0A3B1CZN9_9ZZZZ
MEYRVGSIGRVIVIRFTDGEDLLNGLTEVAQKENIRSAVFQIVGGLKKGGFVVGPEEEQMPPKPVWRELTESHEAFGFGTIFWDEEKPGIHFHGAYSKKDTVKSGCLRRDTEVFLILEVVIFELKGIDAGRIPDAKTGLSLLGFVS